MSVARIFGRTTIFRCENSLRNLSTSKPPSETKETENESTKPQGWISKLFVGQQYDPEGAQKQSHSSLLSASDYVYEITTHNFRPGSTEKYLDCFGEYKKNLEKTLPSVELVGSWNVAYGRTKDQAIHLWRYHKGYLDVDSSIDVLSRDSNLRATDNELAALCGRRKSVLVKSFSYWGEPKPRPERHVYDLRSYVLKPGSMIEWGNAWAKGITYRREHNQDVGGFFAQVGQLYVVYHIWAYPSMIGRNETRNSTWAKPGWDATVAYTVPLIEKMQSKILTATKYSQLK
ncbi:unnamed protein product, partial [Mesorhabditis belari]|uniref:NIPSNAP domain-containing protein n=1 Tax=Mesorhabditis belari TaxID=2138241 RepID=A0AAF3J1Q4_9BILA